MKQVSAAIDQYLLPAGLAAANPQLQRATVGWDGRTDRQTGGRTQDSFIALFRIAGSADNFNTYGPISVTFGPDILVRVSNPFM